MKGEGILSGVRRALASSLTLLLVAACDDATGSIPSEAAGTYTLTRVNDQPVPVTITSTAELRVDITGGGMTVRPDGTYRETRQSRVTDANGTRSGNSFTEGTLHVTGESLEVREREGGRYTGSYTGTALSYTIPAGANSISLTYQKE